MVHTKFDGPSSNLHSHNHHGVHIPHGSRRSHHSHGDGILHSDDGHIHVHIHNYVHNCDDHSHDHHSHIHRSGDSSGTFPGRRLPLLPFRDQLLEPLELQPRHSWGHFVGHLKTKYHFGSYVKHIIPTFKRLHGSHSRNDKSNADDRSHHCGSLSGFSVFAGFEANWC